MSSLSKRAALRLELLEGAVELEGVGGLEPPPRLERGVVDHDVRVGDAPLVVVVVDDGDLMVGEVLRRPLDGEPPQDGEVDAGAGVGGKDVALQALAARPRHALPFPTASLTEPISAVQSQAP